MFPRDTVTVWRLALSRKCQGANCTYCGILRRRAFFLFNGSLRLSEKWCKTVVIRKFCLFIYENPPRQCLTAFWTTFVHCLWAEGRASALQAVAAAWFTRVSWKGLVTNLSQLCAASCADFHRSKSVCFISLILFKIMWFASNRDLIAYSVGPVKKALSFFYGTLFQVSSTTCGAQPWTSI